MIIKEYILIVLAIAIGIYLAIIYPQDKKVINCGIAEISPDYTNEMKEVCRKERMAK